MKSVSRFILIVLAFVVMATNVHALTPREQLNQMVQQLQKNPGDIALREKLIKLGAQLRPAVPAEAERRMVRGSTAFKSATSAAGYQEAAKEFEQATQAAPWYGDAYFNLGVAQDKAGNHEAALRSLKLAQMASPGSKEITNLIYEVEYRNEKARAPEAEAARQAVIEKQKDEALLNSLNGAVFVFRWTDPVGNILDDEFHINGREVTQRHRYIHLSREWAAREGYYVGMVSELGKTRLNSRVFTLFGSKYQIAPDGQTIIREEGAPRTVYRRR